MSDQVTPSQRIIADANALVTVQDARGRSIGVRRLSGALVPRFMRLCGPAADIQTFFGEAVLRAAVVEIDGVPVPFPKSAADVDALWVRVDTDAAQAAADYFAGLADAKADAGPLGGTKPSE